MHKRLPIIIPLLFIPTMILAVYSRAWFTARAVVASNELRTGILSLDMTTSQRLINWAGQEKITSTVIPGQLKSMDITISNSRDYLPARWRIGVKADPGAPEALTRGIIYHLFLLDARGREYVVEEGRLADFLVPAWIYGDTVARTAVDNGFSVPELHSDGTLYPGGVCQLRAIFELTPAAGKEAAGQEFKGSLVLEAAQINQDNWFPSGRAIP